MLISSELVIWFHGFRTFVLVVTMLSYLLPYLLVLESSAREMQFMHFVLRFTGL